MGKYHPHGDQSIYDALVRLAQDFALRYPLVDGQGNFGSIDGDPAAAMRYTEARLARIATEMLRDIDEDTVDFGPELRRLAAASRSSCRRASRTCSSTARRASPSAWRRTSRRTTCARSIDAVVAYIDNPDIDIAGLMQHIKGPDFPTGGDHRRPAGHPRRLRDRPRPRASSAARAHIEPLRQGKEAIIVTELPYQVNKGGATTALIKKIAEVVNDKKIPEISDLRDESDKRGMRLVIELKRDAIPKVVLNKLYKHTTMQTTFGVNMVALVDGVPRTLSLREVIHHYVDHQRDVIVRRTKYELRQAEARAHILEGR